jgi:hypothetical protein
LPDDLIRTADEVYVRFHGPKRWYRHDYSDEELADWATKIGALWATACETALWPAGTFWSAYCDNRDDAVEDVIDADPVATGVRALMTRQTIWTGTASDLLEVLGRLAGESVTKSKTWPKGPGALSGRVRRTATFLRKVGIEVGSERKGRARTRTIEITTIVCPAEPKHEGERPSASSASSAP